MTNLPLVTEEALAYAESNYQGYMSDADDARARRDRLVRQAIAENMTHERIAAATGLTRGRITQIARGGR